MSVIVGSARIDENGNISGGKAGDQTGTEVSTQGWYLHSKGWRVLRAKSAAAREAIAKDMEYACANNKIGYDQNQNTTLYQVAKPLGFDCSKVATACETDCARLVRVCVLYAGINVSDFYTGNEASALLATGAFEALTGSKYEASSEYLKRGDILVTKTQGHTVVVLSDGNKAKSSETSGNNLIYTGQAHSVNFTGYKILIDGYAGPETAKQKGRVLQTALNLDYGAKLTVDGILGSLTKKALGSHYIKKGETQYLVTAVEILYYLNGKDPKGVECPGTYGNGLATCAGKTRLEASDILKLV